MKTTLSITEAAEYVGLHRATLHKHRKKGILTTTTNAKNELVVDVAELHRVYADELMEKQSETPDDTSLPVSVDTSQHPATPDDTREFVEHLKSQLESAEQRERKLMILLHTEQQKNRHLQQHALPSQKRRGIRDLFRFATLL